MKTKVQREISELNPVERREQITKIIKGRRDELVAKILYNTGVDEKIYSECDSWKLEIRIMNRLLKLPRISVEVEEELTEEEIIAKESDELAIGDVDEMFSTAE
jgi:hypothetical protein